MEIVGLCRRSQLARQAQGGPLAPGEEHLAETFQLHLLQLESLVLQDRSHQLTARIVRLQLQPCRGERQADFRQAMELVGIELPVEGDLAQPQVDRQQLLRTGELAEEQGEAAIPQMALVSRQVEPTQLRPQSLEGPTEIAGM